jgi:hypothetical protein
VNALAELLVSAYRRDAALRMTGDLPELPRRQKSEDFQARDQDSFKRTQARTQDKTQA